MTQVTTLKIPWNYSHSTKGTCNDEDCPSYGYCHCNCGEKTSISNRSTPSRNRTKNRPFISKKSHMVANTIQTKGCWSVNGIPIDAARKKLNGLFRIYGNWKTVAYLVDIPFGTIKGIVSKEGIQNISPQKYKKIEDCVARHSLRYDEYGKPYITRLPTPEDEEYELALKTWERHQKTSIAMNRLGGRQG